MRNRRREDPNRPCAVYRHYDDRDVLLYVGITANPQQRWSNHYRGWKVLVARTEVEWFASRRLALTAEAQQIRSLIPVFNFENNARRWHVMAPMYDLLRAALPGKPTLEDVRRCYPQKCLDDRPWEAIEECSTAMLRAFGVVDDGDAIGSDLGLGRQLPRHAFCASSVSSSTFTPTRVSLRHS